MLDLKRRQAIADPRFRSCLLALVASGFALSAPGPASAHGTDPAIAVDAVARVTGSTPRGLHVDILYGDRQVQLAVDPAHLVIVRGYAGEPFLRYSAAGVEGNEVSPTVAADRLFSGPAGRKASLSSRPSWRRLSLERTFAWSDLRLAPSSASFARWTIPLTVDGASAVITGGVWRQAPPPLWLWLACAAPFLLNLVVVIGGKRRTLAHREALVLALLGGAGALAATVAYGVVAAPASTRAFEIVAGLLLALTAAGLVTFTGGGVRTIWIGAVGAAAAFQGLSFLDVLRRGVVVSELPAAAARGVDVLALNAGASALVLVIALYRWGEVRRRPRPRQGARR